MKNRALIEALERVLRAFHAKWMRARFPSHMFMVRDYTVVTR